MQQKILAQFRNSSWFDWTELSELFENYLQKCSQYIAETTTFVFCNHSEDQTQSHWGSGESASLPP